MPDPTVEPAHDERLLGIAEALKPVLSSTEQKPIGLITVHADSSAALGWRAEPAGQIEDLPPMNKGDQCILDYGSHRVGHWSFDIVGISKNIQPADAPARLRLVFGEVLSDVGDSFDGYKGWLSSSWLPEEIINVDFLPQSVKLPRRYAYRYVKIQVIDTSIQFGVKFSNCIAHSLTSAPIHNPPELSFKNAKVALTEAEKKRLRKIDTVALQTLRGCMQTVYEDGPRRDMRLWLGDLRLQALCSYSTFKDYDLAKRCLYLFASMPYDDAGRLCACVYEKPTPHFGGACIVDYCILFTVSLLDYVRASGDKETGKDLYEIALRQVEYYAGMVKPGECYVVPEDMSEGWHFLDWQDALDRQCGLNAVIIFGLRSLISLSELLSLPSPSLKMSSRNLSSISASSLADELTLAARQKFFSKEKKTFVSGPADQISWASNAWSVIAGVAENKEQAAEAMRVAYETEGAVEGNTPYVHHYLCEAFIVAGREDLALKHILTYWGSMVDAGAETFFEGWKPSDPQFSPYGDLHSNSFCHAWSCTPSLLLRQMGFE